VKRVERLHIGCGRSPIPGWLNVDLLALPGVDRVLDVRKRLPFKDVSLLYAEHFLEHLSLDDGLVFLARCRAALSQAGTLRISTPNLDWVMKTHYRSWAWSSDDEAVEDCLNTNRAFHAWGHQLLYNRPLLTLALRTAGFARVTFHRYGESEVPGLSGLERHEPYEDTEEYPHVIIAQAAGVAPPVPEPEAFRSYCRDASAR